ncbi:MAG: TIGR02117 family protein [Flavobacteriales bacterium]
MFGPIRWIFRLLLRLLGLVAALILIYVIAALSLSRIAVPAEANGGTDVTTYILSNGVHTDIVVPVRSSDMDWTRDVSFANTTGHDSSATWVGFGWGDKGFYLETPTWGDLTARVACNAMFGLGHSAMHATFHQQLEEGALCKRITLSHAQYRRLVAYIQDSFAHNAQGHTQAISTHANYGSSDAFYEGVGSYSLFHTCNCWANDGLKACGQKACWWTPTDSGILGQYE